MKTLYPSKKQTILIFQRFSFFLILMITAISCNWNASEKRTSEKAEIHRETANRPNDSSYVVDVVAADYAFGMPSEIPSGWVTFRMKNMGKEEHLGIVDKYPDSLGYKGLSTMISEALKQDGMEGFSPMLGLREEPGQFGGPAMLSPGLTGETTVYLEPGLYAFTCWVKTSDGELHLQKGMIRPFVITNDRTGADKPKSTVNITMADFAIKVDDPVGKGEQVFNVKFEASHNIHMARLEPDQNIEDFKEWMNHITAPSPFKFIGGAEPAPEGMSSTFKATLEPGRYAFATFGRAIHGMVEEITIPENGVATVKGHGKVNEKIIIESDIENTTSPEKIPAGRTPIVVRNTGHEDFAFNFVKMKEGKSVEDFKKYFEGIYINKTTTAEEVTASFYRLGARVIPAGEEYSFILNIDEKEYVMFPFALSGSLEAAWRDGRIVNSIQGVRN